MNEKYYVTEDGGVACGNGLAYEADSLQPGEPRIIARLMNQDDTRTWEEIAPLVERALRKSKRNAR